MNGKLLTGRFLACACPRVSVATSPADKNFEITELKKRTLRLPKGNTDVELGSVGTSLLYSAW
jgi:hypothetical protein